MLKTKDPVIKYGCIFALIYMVSYLTRTNFGAIVSEMERSTGFSKDLLSLSLTGSFITYGAGQLLSGFLGDRVKPRHIIPAGLALAVLCNVGIFFASTIPVMTVIWSVNGFAHALLWPPIVRLMSTHLSAEDYSFAAVRVNQGSSIATIALYLFCPLLLGFLQWRTWEDSHTHWYTTA